MYNHISLFADTFHIFCLQHQHKINAKPHIIFRFGILITCSKTLKIVYCVLTESLHLLVLRRQAGKENLSDTL